MKGILINHSSGQQLNTVKLFPNLYNVSYKDFDEEYVSGFDYIVLSGGHINISGDNDIKREKEFLINTNIPIFGICLGMQILSILDGEKIHCSNQLKNGLFDVDFKGNNLNLYYENYCHIKNVPINYNGYISDGKLEWIIHKNKSIMAVQSHPENSGDSGKFLVDYFFKFVFNSSMNL